MSSQSSPAADDQDGPSPLARAVQTSRSPSQPSRFIRWHYRVLGFCLAIFAFEIGLVLLLFPWSRHWDMSWIPVHSPQLAGLWMSGYFRGLLSGLGALNIYIAVVELFKQLRALFS